MNVLVIGGTGFIGTHLIDRLVNDHVVRIYSPSAGLISKESVQGFSGKVEDIKNLEPHAAWADMVIHLSSTTTPKTSIEDPCYDAASNLLPMIGLLELLKARKTRLIFCSSGGGVYGNAENFPIREDAVKKPTTPYGITKLAMEEYILHYNLNYQTPYLIVRPSNIYGPNVKAVGTLGLINTLVYNSIHHQTTSIWANPSNIRDYIFIEDFMNGFTQLINMNAEGIYNIGSGEGHSISHIIERVEKHLGNKSLIEFPKRYLKDEATNILDIHKINQLTGWLPETSLDMGIKKIADHFLNS